MEVVAATLAGNAVMDVPSVGALKDSDGDIRVGFESRAIMTYR